MNMIGIGDNVVDRYINKNRMFPGGNAVNFAAVAAQCGEQSAYLGVIADDREGRLVRDSLIELGVDVSMSPLESGCVTERCDVELKEGDRVFVGVSYGENGVHRPLRLKEEHLEYLRGFDVIHCGCYAYMEEEMCKLADQKAFRTFDFSCEPEYRTKEYLGKICPYIDMALFSAEEMAEEERDDLAAEVMKYGVKYVLITNGKKGQVLYDGKQKHQGMVKLLEPVDTMGAGDSFFASFVVSIMREGLLTAGALSEEALNRSFEYAADFSARNCLVEGAFGFGVAIDV